MRIEVRLSQPTACYAPGQHAGSSAIAVLVLIILVTAIMAVMAVRAPRAHEALEPAIDQAGLNVPLHYYAPPTRAGL